MRVLGLDLGARRIGVAASDPTGTLASPLTVIERGRSMADDHRRIETLVGEYEAERVVVGLPLSLDGSVGPAARAVLDEVEVLTDALTVPVETYDERFTTVTATRALRDAGKKGKASRAVVDQAAAAVLLQGWLEGRRVHDTPSEER